MFCKNCGSEMNESAVACTNCGFAKGSGNRFCPNCGCEVLDSQPVCSQCGFVLNYQNNNASIRVGSDPGKGFGIASMVLGICSLVFWCCLVYFSFIPAVAGVIFGIIGIVQSKRAGFSNGMAVAGIVCSSIAVIFTLVIFVIIIIYGTAGGFSPEFVEGFYNDFI